MKKSFKIGEKGKSAKPTYQGSPLDLILGEDDEKNTNDKEKEKPEAQKQAIENTQQEKAVKSPKTNKVADARRVTQKGGDSKKSIKQKEKQVDKRRVEDKKKPFSTVLRGSLQKELKELLKQYRQEIDFEYNKAQFMEDAVLRQLNYIKKQLK